MGAPEKVKIHGLKELQRDLKAAEKESTKELKREISATGDLIVNEGRSLLRDETNGSGKLGRTIKSSASGTKGKVSMGGSGSPQAGWIDFGGTIAHKSDNWKSTRKFIPGGRIIYPAFVNKKDEIFRDFEKSLEYLREKYLDQ